MADSVSKRRGLAPPALLKPSAVAGSGSHGGTGDGLRGPAGGASFDTVASPTLGFQPLLPVTLSTVVPEGTRRLVGPYELGPVIGQGSFATVYGATDTRTQEKVAIKVLPKSKLSKETQVQRLVREIRFLRVLNHPHIIKIYNVLESKNHVYVVMEAAMGGELFDYIIDSKRLRPAQARKFMRQIVSALDYCHQNNIVHRDLKPENLLLDSRGNVKVADFGFSNINFKDQLMTTFCGSPYYAPPEMNRGVSYLGPAADAWSLGVILYACLTGTLPFSGPDINTLYRTIRKGVYFVPDYLEPSAVDLLSKLLHLVPQERISMAKAAMHPWMVEGYAGPMPNYLPPRLPVTHPDLGVVQDLIAEQQLELTSDEVAKILTTSPTHPYTTMYHLLCEAAQRRRLQSVSLSNRSSWDSNLSLAAAGASASSTPRALDDRTSSAVNSPRDLGGSVGSDLDGGGGGGGGSTSSSARPPVALGAAGAGRRQPPTSVSMQDFPSAGAATASPPRASAAPAPRHLGVPSGHRTAGDSTPTSPSSRSTSPTPQLPAVPVPRELKSGIHLPFFGGRRRPRTNSVGSSSSLGPGSSGGPSLAWHEGSDSSRSIGVAASSDSNSMDSVYQTRTPPVPALASIRSGKAVSHHALNDPDARSVSSAPESGARARPVSAVLRGPVITEPAGRIPSDAPSGTSTPRSGADSPDTLGRPVDEAGAARFSSLHSVATAGRLASAATAPPTDEVAAMALGPRSTASMPAAAHGASRLAQAASPTGSSKPRRAKISGIFRLSTTSRKDRATIVRELERALAETGMTFAWLESQRSLRFEDGANGTCATIDIVPLKDLGMYGLKFRRLRGSVWSHKRTVERLLAVTQL